MSDKPVVGSIVFGPVQQFEALTGMGAVIVEGAQVHAVANELAALRARVAELEKDAARYRWLRGVRFWHRAVDDAEIDAAMARSAAMDAMVQESEKLGLYTDFDKPAK